MTEQDEGFLKGTVFECPYCDVPMSTIWGWYNVFIGCFCCDLELDIEIKNPDKLFFKPEENKRYKLKGFEAE